MFKSLFNIVIKLVITLIQIVLWPLNQLTSNLFPTISDTIIQTSSSLVGMFDGIGWALGLIPESIKTTIIIIITLEIAKHSCYVLTHIIVKVWNVIQKIKVW